MLPNYYSRLNVPRTANLYEIRRAYRKLALHYHPDKNHAHNAHEIFVGINEAYLILSDKEAKAKYDEEYDYYYSKSSILEFESKKTDYKTSYSTTFTDIDLKKWSQNARQQGEEFSRMNFTEFSKIVLDYLKETGFVFSKVVSMPFGVMMIIASLPLFVVGLSSGGETVNMSFSGIALLIGGIFLIAYSTKLSKK